MSLEVQIDALRAAGCTVIRSERRSGTTLNDRTELKTLLDFLREGDTLCVTRVDRIARSVTDLMIIVRILEQKGVALKATEQPIDTSSAVGGSLLSMLGVFAELETNLRRERQMESIRRASRRSTARSQSTSAPTRAASRRFSRMRCAVSG
jgi:DNA invertase Pin-like site-specific DNA recombinase